MPDKTKEKEKQKENGDIETIDGVKCYRRKKLNPATDIIEDMFWYGFVHEVDYGVTEKIFFINDKGKIYHTKDCRVDINGKKYIFDYRKKIFTDIDADWDIKKALTFVKDYTKPEYSIPNGKKLYEEIEKELYKYVVFEDMEEAVTTVLTIFISYVFPVLGDCTYVYAQGLKETGKSQLLTFFERLCRGAVRGHATEAAMGDLISDTRCPFIFDDFEGYDVKEQKSMIAILADGYRKCGGTRIVLDKESKKRGKPLVKKTYSPKYFATFESLPKNVKDRTIILQMLKSEKPLFDPAEEETDWKELKHKLYMFSLHNVFRIKTIFEETNMVRKAKKLKGGRQVDIWKPYETMLEVLSLGKYKERMKQFFIDRYSLTKSLPDEASLQIIENLTEEVLKQRTKTIEYVSSELSIDNDTISTQGEKISPIARGIRIRNKIFELGLIKSQKHGRAGEVITSDSSRILKMYKIYIDPNSKYVMSNKPSQPSQPSQSSRGVQKRFLPMN